MAAIEIERTRYLKKNSDELSENQDVANIRPSQSKPVFSAGRRHDAPARARRAREAAGAGDTIVAGMVELLE
jgi:hypothetical protein